MAAIYPKPKITPATNHDNAHLIIVIIVSADVNAPAFDADTQTIIGLMNKLQYPI